MSEPPERDPAQEREKRGADAVSRIPVGAGVRRWSIAVAGGAVVIVGLILVPLPGPGWATVFVGLGILATEFRWADRLLRHAKARLLTWTRWTERQPLIVRLVIGTAGLLALAALIYLVLLLYGALPEALHR